jgi:ketosteroid isomerase-like protein
VPRDVEQRLADLEARAEILELLHRYSAAVDYGDEAGWADCFTEDAHFDSENMSSGARSALGHSRAELAEHVTGHTRAPELYHKHLTMVPTIRVEGHEASCRAYFCILVRGRGGAPELAAFGRYVDRLRREVDGRWRIARRIAEIEAWTPPWTLRRADLEAMIGVTGEG